MELEEGACNLETRELPKVKISRRDDGRSCLRLRLGRVYPQDRKGQEMLRVLLLTLSTY